MLVDIYEGVHIYVRIENYNLKIPYCLLINYTKILFSKINKINEIFTKNQSVLTNTTGTLKKYMFPSKNIFNQKLIKKKHFNSNYKMNV